VYANIPICVVMNDLSPTPTTDLVVVIHGGVCMAWHGMAWHGMAWHGMAWHSTA
jgi:hypothetical protein